MSAQWGSPNRRDYLKAQKEWAERYSRVDEILYDVCKRWPHHNDLAVVQAKVIIIDRTYLAGLERKGRKDKRIGILETVANLLYQHRKQIDEQLAILRGIKKLSINSSELILSLHGEIVSILVQGTRSKIIFRSFISKYLHFHTPVVPIFDRLTSDVLNHWYPWREYRKRRLVPQKTEYDNVYYKFFSQFLLLSSKLKGLNLKPTVRCIDYYLMWSWYD